jgi:hypothetical protein
MATANICPAVEFEPPELHADVSIQTLFFFDEDDRIPYLSASSDKTEIRHAAIEAEGMLGKHLEYNVEIGLSTCAGGGCSTSGSLSLAEAGIFFKPYDYLKIGLFQGHIMRGFELYQECTEVLTAEKPRFKSIFPCHPQGMMIETDYMFDENMGINAQFTFNNGNSGTSSIEDEHDINLGLQFHTPYPGLSLGGFYNDWQWKTSEYDPAISDFRSTSYNGSRIGGGLDYDYQGLKIRSEYYLIDGYVDSDPIRDYTSGSDTLKAEDLESYGFFVQGGYAFALKSEMIPFIQPYMMYQLWDKASNADGDNKLTYFTLGVACGLGSQQAFLKIDYEIPLDSPDDTFDEAKRLIVRITGGF